MYLQPKFLTPCARLDFGSSVVAWMKMQLVHVLNLYLRLSMPPLLKMLLSCRLVSASFLLVLAR